MPPILRPILITLCAYLLFNSWLIVSYPEPIVTTTPVVHIVKPEPVIIYDGVARVTCYGPTGYRTASQKVPAYGMVASSDRTIPLGTKVIIEGYEDKPFTVEDRTAKWVHEKFGLTFDIFIQEACTKHFGSWNLKYKLLTPGGINK